MRRVDLRPIGQISSVGQTWTSFGNRIAAVPGLSGGADSLVAVADDGIYKSIDYGYSWIKISSGTFSNVTHIIYNSNLKIFYIAIKTTNGYTINAINIEGKPVNYTTGIVNLYDQSVTTISSILFDGVWHDNWHWPKRKHCGSFLGRGWKVDSFEPESLWTLNDGFIPLFKPYGAIAEGVTISASDFTPYVYSSIDGEPIDPLARRGTFIGHDLDFDVCTATGTMFFSGMIQFQKEGITRRYLTCRSLVQGSSLYKIGRTYIREDEIDNVRPASCVANRKGHVIYSHAGKIKYRMVEFGTKIKYPRNFDFRLGMYINENMCGADFFVGYNACVPFKYSPTDSSSSAAYCYNKNGDHKYGFGENTSSPGYVVSYRNTYDFNWNKGPDVANSGYDSLMLRSTENSTQSYLYAILKRSHVLSYKRLDISSSVGGTPDYEVIGSRTWTSEVVVATDCDGEYSAIISENGSGMYIVYKSLDGIYKYIKIGVSVGAITNLSNATGAQSVNLPKKIIFQNPLDILPVSPVVVVKDNNVQIFTVVGDAPVISIINSTAFEAGDAYIYDVSNANIEEGKKVKLTSGDAPVTWSIVSKSAKDDFSGSMMNSLVSGLTIDSSTGAISYIIPATFKSGWFKYTVKAENNYGVDSQDIQISVQVPVSNPDIHLVQPVVNNGVATNVSINSPIDIDVYWNMRSSIDYYYSQFVILSIDNVEYSSLDILTRSSGWIIKPNTRLAAGASLSGNEINHVGGWNKYVLKKSWKYGDQVSVKIQANHRMPSNYGQPQNPIDATSIYEFVMNIELGTSTISLVPGWNFIGIPFDDSVNIKSGYIIAAGNTASGFASKIISENGLAQGDIESIMRYNSNTSKYSDALERWDCGGNDSSWKIDGAHGYFIKIKDGVTSKIKVNFTGRFWDISTLQLKEGHNWISLPKNDFKTVSNLLSNAYIEEVQWFDSTKQMLNTVTGFWNSTSGFELSSGRGYIVVVNADTQLVFSGDSW